MMPGRHGRYSGWVRLRQRPPGNGRQAAAADHRPVRRYSDGLA
jgi:hypothetical protein